MNDDRLDAFCRLVTLSRLTRRQNASRIKRIVMYLVADIYQWSLLFWRDSVLPGLPSRKRGGVGV